MSVSGAGGQGGGIVDMIKQLLESAGGAGQSGATQGASGQGGGQSHGAGHHGPGAGGAASAMGPAATIHASHGS